MGRKRSGKARLHKASGRAFIELGGERIYLEAPYSARKDSACQKEYDHLYHTWMANGGKHPPSKAAEVSGITCGELAAHYMKWAEQYHIPREGEPPKELDHCRQAVKFLVRHYRDLPAVEFSVASLEFLQGRLLEHKARNKQGRYSRPIIRKYINTIRDVFRRGAKYHGVPKNVYYDLQEHEHLKKGKTQAHEYRKPKPVAEDIVEKTLPFMPPIIADMVRVHILIGGRCKEIRMMRYCDINFEAEEGVWSYDPPSHVKKVPDEMPKAIGPRAQAILTPYLLEKADTPEAYLFSPKDSVHLKNIDKRRKRKTLNKRGQVQPSQRNRKKQNPKKVPGEYYSKSAYYRAIREACDRAGVERWTPSQLRKTSAVEARKMGGLDAAQARLGHKQSKTTETFYAPAEFKKAAEVARKIG